MITLRVPTFDEFNGYKFIEFKTIKVKNKIDTKDYNKVTNLLSGIPQGYCKGLYDIKETKKPIEVTRFYDTRQGKNVNKFKGYFITVAT